MGLKWFDYFLEVQTAVKVVSKFDSYFKVYIKVVKVEKNAISKWGRVF